MDKIPVDRIFFKDDNCNFTSDDHRSIQEMLDERDRLRIAVSKRNFEDLISPDGKLYRYENMSVEDLEICHEYAKSQYFFTTVRSVLDFAKTSTGVFAEFSSNGDIKCASLFNSVQEYAKAVVTLTGGFDKRMSEEIEETRTTPFRSSFMQKDEYDSSVNAPLDCGVVKKTIMEEIGNSDIMNERTVGDVVDIIYHIMEIEYEYSIAPETENVIEDTTTVVVNENNNDRLNVFGYDDELSDDYEDIRYNFKNLMNIIECTFKGSIKPVTPEDIEMWCEDERRDSQSDSSYIHYNSSDNQEKNCRIEEMTAALNDAQEREKTLLEALEKNQLMLEKMMEMQQKANNEKTSTKKGFLSRLFRKK